MGHGGRRPGAGRKPKAERRGEPPVQAAERKLRDRLPELVDVALALAIEGRDPKMVTYCINRVLGAPVQPIDLDVRRLADRLAANTGADPEFLIRRAQQLAADSQASTGS